MNRDSGNEKTLLEHAYELGMTADDWGDIEAARCADTLPAPPNDGPEEETTIDRGPPLRWAAGDRCSWRGHEGRVIRVYTDSSTAIIDIADGLQYIVSIAELELVPFATATVPR